MRELTATVVGGGIAGLASATALARAGWRTTVVERTGSFGEVGAGVAIPRNGIAALRSLGVDDDAVAALGHEDLGTGFRDSAGRWILRIPDDDPAVRWTITIWGVHRARLHATLQAAARAAGVELVTGATVTAVDAGAPGAAPGSVTWLEGATERRLESDLVVGADGMWSAVRGAVFPRSRPRYSGSTSWRAVVRDTASEGRLVEMWGAGAEFGAMRISESELYWYGYFRHPEGATFDDELTAARDRFAGWSPWALDLIEATDPDRLLRHDVYHLPGGLPSYQRGRVVMVGDAAHAALPTMGQGAASALEDGASLGPLVGSAVVAGRDLSGALAAFDAARRPRCRAIARNARLMARFGADLGGGWRQPVRNSLLRLAPGAGVARAGGSIVRWVPPTAPNASGETVPGAA
ncbi:monooxygenase FAD-binding [Beutenbergia cavernae DSM 12333]|uniref:Monooxygenase FAD-binding n=2 Tax=Beutenbergia TaxID=84756 RepID=C5C0U9_BEUC1|nr:monooxygenase FAD-binding [Beutenbergia cavernae DSM 12333]